MGIFTYFKLGIVGVVALAIGFLYVQNLRKDRQIYNLKVEKEVAEANLQVAEKTIKLLKEYQDVEEIISNAPDDDVAEYLRTGVWPKTNSKANDSSSSNPGQPKTGKPKSGQERQD